MAMRTGRVVMTEDAVFRFGRFALVPARRQLLADGEPVALGARAIDLLQVLVERRERTVPKSDLLDLVWPDVVVEEANLAVQVSALRKVVGAQAIATVPGRGYRFVAPIDQEISPAAEATEAPLPGRIRLPVQPSPLIGRDLELHMLTERVLAHPLVTLTGASGIGKTRLALAIAQAVAPRWRDGVAWVEAASVQDSGQLPQAVAASLGVQLQGSPSAETLAAALKSRSMLLLLDNAEHVISGAVQVVLALRTSAPRVHVLLTSQEAMRVAGEEVFRVPPLALPAAGDVPDERFGAIALFVERARAVDRRFVLDPLKGRIVADICGTLDAIPLAIELAAARVPLLGLEGLRDRLGERLRLLTGGARDAARRHQTLRAALEWSHALLTPTERKLLRRLGVFVGGFSLELAQAVACDPDGGDLDAWAVLDALGGLIDKSLVAVDQGEPVRYRLLETMRIFALERLAEAGETPSCRAAHAQALTALFETVDEARWGDSGTMGTREATRILRPEVDNARVALAWLLEARHWPAAIALAGASAPMYVQLGLIRDLLPAMRSLLEHIEQGSPSAQVNLLSNIGKSGLYIGMTLDELHALKEAAVRRARSAGFHRRLQTTLASLGYAMVRRGDIAAAERIIGELLTLEKEDDPPGVRVPGMLVETAIHEQRRDVSAAIASLERQRVLLRAEPDLINCEANLAMFLNDAGRYEEAADIGLKLVGRPDLPRHFLHVISNTAYALIALGRIDEARRILGDRRVDLSSMPIGMSSAEALGALCLAEGRLDDAVRIDAALERYRVRTGNASNTMTSAFRQRLQEALKASQVAVDDIEAWRLEGETLSDEAAVAIALD
jgi:predicted ATPase/DNA-binding winged helix-turn-helix (wHTH) protein